MANSSIAINEPGTVTKRADTEQLTVAAVVVERERVQIAGDVAAAIASVLNANPAGSEYSLLVRTLQGFAAGTPMFTDPIDRALRDMGKIDIAGFDVALPSGTNFIGRVRLTDGTNDVTTLFDVDSGVGVQNVQGVVLRKSASGGSVELGTATDPVRTDPTGTTAQPVTDNAGSLTIDAPVATPVAVRISDGAAFYDAAKTGQLPTVLVGGRLDVNVGAALPAGTANIGKVDARVRNAADAAYIEPSTLGEQQTQTTALQLIDNLPHGMNAAFSNAAPVAGQLDDTATTVATEDNIAPARITAQRAFHINLRNVAGAEVGIAGAPVRVDPTGTTAQPVTDNAGTLTVDAPVATPVAVRISDGAAFIVPATDRTTAAAPFSIRLSDGAAFYDATKTGQLPAALVAGRLDINIGAVGAVTFDVSDRAARLVGQVEGRAAHNVALAGNPNRVGGRASAGQLAAVTDGVTVDLVADRHGNLRVRAGVEAPATVVGTNVNFPAVNTRASVTKAAGAAGIRHICTGLTVVLAAGATTPAAVQLDVRLRDGIADTGTILWQTVIALPATAGVMNGVSRSGLWIPGTAATAMTLEFSAAGGANTFESVSFETVDITE